MRDTRTNALLIHVIIHEENLVIDEKSSITIFFNGTSITGKLLSDDQYYNLKSNMKYKEIYEKYIKAPREPYIKNLKENKNINEFPDNLKQAFLYIITESGESMQIRIADVAGFSFN